MLGNVLSMIYRCVKFRLNLSFFKSIRGMIVPYRANSFFNPRFLLTRGLLLSFFSSLLLFSFLRRNFRSRQRNNLDEFEIKILATEFGSKDASSPRLYRRIFTRVFMVIFQISLTHSARSRRTNERNAGKGKSVCPIREGESRSVKLAVKSREIRALMAFGYDQTN